MDIAIIGFGVSGIACCRWALHYGFTPTVYDKNSSINKIKCKLIIFYNNN